MGEFSRRTVVKAIDVLVLDSFLNQAATSHLFITLGPEINRGVRGEEVSIRKRMNDLMEFVDEHPSFVIDDGLLESVLVGKALTLVSSQYGEDWWTETDWMPTAIEGFKYALQQDGFVVTNGSLRLALPEDMGLPEVEAELIRLLRKHRFVTAEGHLEQAFDAHVSGNWASANAQIRTFLDALLDEIAEKIDPSAHTVGSGHPRRVKLASKGFLSKYLNEWSDDGKGFVNGLVRRLHPQGAHPGLSDEDDSTFRLHVVLLTSALLLRRYDRDVT